ncbi:MAG TPA: hypothetical protein VFX98_17920 [Longimicrobiaceae bacterium]|nr:hypothetical protein [Longimicrobiaceae bacterium]
MQTLLFQAHSGLRYLVLLAAAVALVVLAYGYARRRPLDRAARIATAAFTGLLDLQVVLGIGLVLTGVFYPSLIGHMMLMLLAAGAAHGFSMAGRKSADARRGYLLALVGVALALGLMVAGIGAIGRGVLQSTERPSAGAAE